ncbi:MAG TPA: MFS transporter [Acidimicrobiales bacterium]|nr:MFS transporter [Acidimicrobiales bacterium]
MTAVGESSAPAPEASPAPALVLTHRRVLVVIGALLLGMFLAALDQTVVSTALPTIVGDLHGATHLTWVVTAYLLSSTVSTPLWGKLGDQYGRKVFFQASIVIFLLGSVLSGLSSSMLELIIFRALQGLGGGGLMVGAQTIVGDVVSPRDRGRYMGLFMAMYGVTTVIGPLIGGIFVDSIGWRWIFYINVPLGAAALVVTAVALPGALSRVHRVIDYLGTALLALSATALVLFTSLGGTSYPWGSPLMIGFAVVGVVMAVLFVWTERRAAEPVIPMGLFRNRVFSAASAIGFVVGFAMYGALTFLPLFLQVVKGVSPTMSGVRLFPMMLGLLIASIGSGQVVSRSGRYKVFPVAGTACMSVGIYLMSLIGVTTGVWAMSAYMFVFGVGLGLVMQVLVVAVQNAVPYEELGTATSASTFFRMIGGSFGTAVFGAIFANKLAGNLVHYLGGAHIPAGVASQIDNPALVAKLPTVVRAGVAEGVSHTVESVFLVGVPICIAAFLLSWLLPEVPLRRSIRTTDAGEGLSVAEPRTSLKEVQRALERVTARENRADLYHRLAERAGVDLPPRACWLLYRLADRPGATVEQVAGRLKVSPEQLAPALAALIDAGMVTASPERSHGGRSTDGPGDGASSDGRYRLTEQGRQAVDRLTEARRAGLTELLEGWDPEAHPELVGMVRRLAHELLADDERLLAEAHKGAVTAAG